LETSHKHPERENWYKKPIFQMPNKEKISRALLKSLGGSYATDPSITQERLRKKLRALNYEIIE
jgi:hypothetical protein